MRHIPVSNTPDPVMSPQPDRPETHPRRILLAVTGLSPPVVTETLYALAVERRWVPTEIRLVTTGRGAEEAERALLSDDPGWFHRLCADYRLPEIIFGPDDIHVIAGPHGEPLNDILTEADNAAVADFITEQVRLLTADPGASLHVSIAGGRKTMGFYVGYALSLFGRAQDRLSHVLVSPPFEQAPEFFSPAPVTRFVRAQGQTLDAHAARVHLGDIPFVRLRDGLTDHILQGRLSFSEAVKEAQKALPPVALRLDPATRTVTAGGESFVLDRPLFALYWLMARRCRDGQDGVHYSDAVARDDLLACYRQLVNVHSAAYEQAEQAYRSFTKDNFDPAKSHINAALKRHLGERRAAPYLIGRRDRIAGTRYHRFGLSLPPEAVSIGPAASLPARQPAATPAYDRKIVGRPVRTEQPIRASAPDRERGET